MKVGAIKRSGGLASVRATAGALFLLVCFAVAPARGQEGGGASPAALPQPAAVPERYADREKGKRALADGVYSAAVRFFTKYRETVGTAEPDFAEATGLLVKAHLLSGQAAQAEEALAHHAANSAGVDDPARADGLAYWRCAVLAAKNELDAAAGRLLELAEEARAREIRAQALALLGTVYARQEKWAEAEAAFTRLTVEYPEAASLFEAQLGLIKVCIAAGRAAEAETRLAALEAGQPPPAARRQVTLHRVLLLASQDKLDEALAAYRTVEEFRPAGHDADWWLAASALAERLVAAGRFEPGLSLVQQALGLAPNAAKRLLMRLNEVQCLLGLEQVDRARETAERMRTESPQAVETGQAHVTLGDHLRRAADPAGAAALYAVAADSEAMPSALRYRAGVSQGWALSEARQYEAAAQAFSKASRNGKDKAETFTALGLAGDAAARGGNYNGAALFYQNVADNDVGSVLGEAARLKQAQARVNAKLYSDAALVYRQFIEEYPNSPQRPKATLERALALRDGGDFRQALAEAGQFVKDYPADAEAPRALMAACAAAKAAGDPAAAIVALTQLIDGYAGSDLYPHALYERTHLGFLQRNTAAALADAERFLAQYAQLPLAADIHMWLGDHYAALGEPVTAESHYLEAANAHPTLPLAQTALYEAAASAFRRDDRERAKKLLVQLGNDYAANPAARVHARAQLLFGDILAREGSYAEAIEHFTRGGTLSDATDLALAAKGRTGDMHYSLGAAGGEDAAKAAEHLRKALDVFTSLAAAPNASRELRDSARYRAAKTCEKLGDNEAAIHLYSDIVYDYDLDLQAGAARDWYYFARSGYDAARLLVMGGQYEQAARIYERLAGSGIPTAAEAGERADEIRRTRKDTP